MSYRASFGSKKFWVVLLLAGLLSPVPGRYVSAAETQWLKVAVPFPRTPEIVVEVDRYNKKLAALTDNTVQVRVYWGGAAGDDLDVLRKVKTGQLDAAPFSIELVSSFVRQALVLASPGLFLNYKQLDAVRDALTPDMDKEAYNNGFKVMGWGDVGRLRLFSKAPVSKVEDFRRVRPWLYPQSEMLKDFYKLIKATGIPLGLVEVYGGLQTNMIDLVWASSVLTVALQWHTATHYLSEQGLGFIGGAFVMRRPAWEALPEAAQKSMQEVAAEVKVKNQAEVRKADELTYKKLLERGHKPVQLENIQDWIKAGGQVREHMVGRIYTRELLTKAETIANQHADPIPATNN
jgi:TRAP-type C4-dicarboxylate transport system substrate-binding protein